MPVSDKLPYQWYDTPNIHLCTVADFDAFLRERNCVVENRVVLAGGRRGRDAAEPARRARDLPLPPRVTVTPSANGARAESADDAIRASRATAPPARETWREALFNRRMLICVFTGFSSGLPLYLLHQPAAGVAALRGRRPRRRSASSR